MASHVQAAPCGPWKPCGSKDFPNSHLQAVIAHAPARQQRPGATLPIKLVPVGECAVNVNDLNTDTQGEANTAMGATVVCRLDRQCRARGSQISSLANLEGGHQICFLSFRTLRAPQIFESKFRKSLSGRQARGHASGAVLCRDSRPSIRLSICRRGIPNGTVADRTLRGIAPI